MASKEDCISSDFKADNQRLCTISFFFLVENEERQPVYEEIQDGSAHQPSKGEK